MYTKDELSLFTEEQLREKLQLASQEVDVLRKEVDELIPKVFTSHPALTPAQNADVNLLMNSKFIFNEEHRDAFIGTYVEGRKSRDKEVADLMSKLKSGGHV